MRKENLHMLLSPMENTARQLPFNRLLSSFAPGRIPDTMQQSELSLTASPLFLFQERWRLLAQCDKNHMKRLTDCVTVLTSRNVDVVRWATTHNLIRDPPANVHEILQNPQMCDSLLQFDDPVEVLQCFFPQGMDPIADEAVENADKACATALQHMLLLPRDMAEKAVRLIKYLHLTEQWIPDAILDIKADFPKHVCPGKELAGGIILDKLVCEVHSYCISTEDEMFLQTFVQYEAYDAAAQVVWEAWTKEGEEQAEEEEEDHDDAERADRAELAAFNREFDREWERAVRWQEKVISPSLVRPIGHPEGLLEFVRVLRDVENIPFPISLRDRAICSMLDSGLIDLQGMDRVFVPEGGVEEFFQPNSARFTVLYGYALLKNMERYQFYAEQSGICPLEVNCLHHVSKTAGRESEFFNWLAERLCSPEAEHMQIDMLNLMEKRSKMLFAMYPKLFHAESVANGVISQEHYDQLKHLPLRDAVAILRLKPGSRQFAEYMWNAYELIPTFNGVLLTGLVDVLPLFYEHPTWMPHPNLRKVVFISSMNSKITDISYEMGDKQTRISGGLRPVVYVNRNSRYRVWWPGREDSATLTIRTPGYLSLEDWNTAVAGRCTPETIRSLEKALVHPECFKDMYLRMQIADKIRAPIVRNFIVPTSVIMRHIYRLRVREHGKTMDEMFPDLMALDAIDWHESDLGAFMRLSTSKYLKREAPDEILADLLRRACHNHWLKTLQYLLDHYPALCKRTLRTLLDKDDTFATSGVMLIISRWLISNP